ncbi:MAG: AAA-like domain-containing protein [Calothrix sp. MO_167.B42]|nr:AAA-like domain-containing protein [Calothrix sp. MO_167.B42]
MVKKILLLSANPTNTSKLRLDEEVREIQAGLERAKGRDEFEIIPKLAVRTGDLRRALLDYKPQIVHFSGHGEGKQGLALENESGQMQLVSASALARLFKLFPQVECVVLNACYSQEQAEAINQHIDYVIGMNAAIGDRAAIKFAVGFYDALGAGRTIEDGFEFGCTSLDLESIPESATPVLKSRKNREEALISEASKRIFVSYKRDVQPDEPIALQIVQALSSQHQVFIDQNILVGTSWAELIETEIRRADFLIVLLSEHSVHSEMVEVEIQMAHKFAQEQSGKPAILPVRLAYRQPFQYPLSAYLNHINWAYWNGEQDTPRIIEELNQAIRGEQLSISEAQAKTDLLQESKPSPLPRPFSSAQPVQLEMPSGTMDTESPFYVERPADVKALRTITQSGKGVTIVIKGARQVGKSSLLIHIMNAAQKAGKQFAFLDFQQFSQAALRDADLFFRRFCFWLTDVLEMEDQLEEYWNPDLGNNRCCTRYMGRYILQALGKPLVLAMDEVDKVFDSDFRSDFFGMLRSWHNSRATMPIWKKLDLVLVTSTEPYELIPDLTQSPFNVGEVIELEDFTLEQVSELNRRHGSPLNSSEERQLMVLLGGHPFLVRRALYLVASGQISSSDLFAHATAEHGAFGDHLRHHISLLHDKQELIQGLLEIITHNTCKDRLIFWRLRGAGLVRSSGKTVTTRCQLYADYFRDNLYG